MTTDTTAPDARSPHHIEITLAHGGDVNATVSCSAPVGAPCRLHCGICEDYWNDDHNDHEMTDQGYCLAVEGWFDDPMFVLEMYDGEPRPIRCGPIVTTWDGDGMTWHYAEAVA